jgi:hypothetical protein
MGMATGQAAVPVAVVPVAAGSANRVVAGHKFIIISFAGRLFISDHLKEDLGNPYQQRWV